MKSPWIRLLIVFTVIVIAALGLTFYLAYPDIVFYFTPEPPQLKAGDAKFNELEKRYLFLVGSREGLCEVDIRAKKATKIHLKEKYFNDADIRGMTTMQLVGITENMFIVKSDQVLSTCTGWSLFFYDTVQRRRINRLDLSPDPAIGHELLDDAVIWDGKDGVFAYLCSPGSHIIHYDFRKNILSEVVRDTSASLAGFNKTNQYLILREFTSPVEKEKTLALSWPGGKITDLNLYGRVWDINLSGDDRYLSYNKVYDLHLRDMETGKERVISNVSSHSWSLDSKLLMTNGVERDPTLQLPIDPKFAQTPFMVGPPENISVYSPTEDWQLKILELAPTYGGSFGPYVILPKNCPTAKFLSNMAR